MWCTDWVICRVKKNPWPFRSLISATAFGRSRCTTRGPTRSVNLDCNTARLLHGGGAKLERRHTARNSRRSALAYRLRCYHAAHLHERHARRSRGNSTRAKPDPVLPVEPVRRENENEGLEQDPENGETRGPGQVFDHPAALG